MMHYVRFMGETELIRYLKGEILKNTTNWKGKAKNTESVGFCFFDDSVKPEERIEYLTGVVDMEWVALFEPIGDINFKESKGLYRDPEQDAPKSLIAALFEPVITMDVKEYSLTEYGKMNLRLVAFGKPYMTESGEYAIHWEAAYENYRSDQKNR